MQVSNPNNIKIYNLSAGKALPDWLTDRKKRSLQKSDVEIQRRIELMQDFEMPTCSNSIKLSADKQYILATGVYKPRVRCYDVAQMSMKFERCMDSEVVKFLLLAEDYSKIVFLQNDRYVEFHAQHGRYYRTRLPMYGRDLAFHQASAEIYFVGVSSEIHRLSLDLGRFMIPMKSTASEINCCQFNPCHDLLACGTKEGQVECWDPRSRNRVGMLDCAASVLKENGTDLTGVPAVTALTYKDALQMAVGTSTGQVLLYDIRMNEPLLIKDHNFGLPIVDVVYHTTQDLMLSCDSRILKIWDRHNGKPFTSIEPESTINSLCLVPGSGMFFLANEAPKMLTYYIPALGPAPKWCSFLDSLTEELEENPTPTVYDDYKFLTRQELESLGLSHLIGTNLVKAYMHGFFIDIRLYKRTKSVVDPFAYSEYHEKKIREQREVENRVKVNKLPQVNRRLAEKLMDMETEVTTSTKAAKKKAVRTNLLHDSRFSEMFMNSDFQVDEESEEYRLLNPLVSKLDKERRKQKEKEIKQDQQMDSEQEEEEEEGRASSDETESSDDEHTYREEMKQLHRKLKQEKYEKERAERQKALERHVKPKFIEVNDKLSNTDDKSAKKLSKKSLLERVRGEEESGVMESGGAYGNLEMSYQLKQSGASSRRDEENRKHFKERKKLRRSTGSLKSNQGPRKFYMGRPVR